MCTLQPPIYIGRGRGGRQKCLNGRRGKVYIYVYTYTHGRGRGWKTNNLCWTGRFCIIIHIAIYTFILYMCTRRDRFQLKCPFKEKAQSGAWGEVSGLLREGK